MLIDSVCASAQNFTATISYGIPVEVFTWPGNTDIEHWAADALYSTDAQGILVILGRDDKKIWYIEAGRDHDIDEGGYFENILCIFFSY